MVSESHPSGRPVLTLDELARPLTHRPERLHALTASELAVAFSLGLDLAEGKAVGHAQRVCYIATLLADALALDAPARNAVYFGALLHDVGVTLAASDICRVAGIDEDTIFGPAPLKSVEELRADLTFADLSAVVDAVQQHSLLGAETLRALDLPDEVAAGVAAHHERWDGFGFPAGTAGEAIPLEARVIAVADTAESLIAAESSSLAARRRLAPAIGRYVAVTLDPAVVARLLELGQSDEFWLGLYAEDMPDTLHSLRPPADSRKSRKRVLRFAEVFADIADAKGGHTVGHSRRTADGAQKLAEALALDAGHVEMIRIAALLHDIGLLGVPARIMSKPDILSVTEMQVMRQHPANSEMVLQALNGFEEIAFWVARHHERPDGKGYPEMLTGDELPLESRILAVADVYSALTAERAHRGALLPADATRILLGAAGTQLDPELVRTFIAAL
ncbi:MAG: HD domain-containing protein [Dehalococcoidia bacterium]|nr:HD domain-containing protein [Dehalococcoidia bacterium]